MKNIHIIPTDKPSRLYQKDGNFKLDTSAAIDWFISSAGYQPQNIYITSAEEIKVEDWYYLPRTNSVHKCIEDPTELNLEIRLGVAKIILSTDQSLIVDGVQAIDDTFLEWFVKNPTCELVMVRAKPPVRAIVKGIGIKSFDNGYKIIIPKSELASKLKEILDNMSQEEFNEEWKKITNLKMEGPSIIIPKEEPKTAWVGVLHDKLNEYHPAEYELKDIYQGEGCLPNFPNEELCQIWCDSNYKELPKEEQKQHLIDMMNEEPKQETLEDASWKYNPLKKLDGEFLRHAFKEGAKWQQERSYSEEDMNLAFETGRNFQLTGENNFKELLK